MHARHDDEGFSLVEVVIAMFLLAVIAVAILPLMIGATRTGTVNRDVTSATSFANARLAPITAAFPLTGASGSTCTNLRTHAATGVVDPAGTGLTATTAVGACPSAYPGTVTVTVTVKNTTGTTLVTLPTRIPVSAS